MTVLNDTNRNRVSKIYEMLLLIEKSAQSNKASQEELWDLLNCVVDTIQGLLDPEARPQQEAPQRASQAPEFEGLSAGQRAAMILADRASLKELIASLSGRLDLFLEQTKD